MSHFSFFISLNANNTNNIDNRAFTMILIIHTTFNLYFNSDINNLNVMISTL